MQDILLFFLQSIIFRHRLISLDNAILKISEHDESLDYVLHLLCASPRMQGHIELCGQICIILRLIHYLLLVLCGLIGRSRHLLNCGLFLLQH